MIFGVYTLNMIRNADLLEEFERRFLRENKLTLEEKFKIYEWMYEEVKALGRLPEDPLEGIDVKIRMARILNGIQRGS